MRPVYGRSPWVGQFPKSRLPAFPRLKGHATAEVVVIGGGLTGCATAYAFAAAGVDVVLLEAERLGQGPSGSSAGWITDTPTVPFAVSDAALGRRAAKQAWQAWRRAALDLGALVRRRGLSSRFDRRPSLTFARTADAADMLRREHRLRTSAALDLQLLPARAASAIAGCPAMAGVRTTQSALVDPYRLTLAFAAAAVSRGARIFERTAVTRTSSTRDEATAAVGRAATIRASRLVVTTTAPGTLFPALDRHLPLATAFHVLTEPVPAAIRPVLGRRDCLLRDDADPPHRIAWIDDERLLVSGADGGVVPATRRHATLVQRTGQLMYELSTIYPDISGLQPAAGWDQPYATTATGLPLVGPHRHYPRHLFAFGTVGASLTGAGLASRLLVRHYRQETDAADLAFAFGR
ncbi:MAG: FAD-binding oxidoreductase [Vicinamibacterales bacterium]